MRDKLLIKSFTILLLTAIAFNSLFYYVFFHISVINARYQSHEWLARADKASLEVIKLPARNFDKDDTDDVWYNGKMYDVAGWKAVNDTIYVYVLPDAQEQALVSKMESRYIASNDCTYAHDGKTPVIKPVNRLSSIIFFFQPTTLQLYSFKRSSISSVRAKRPISLLSEVITPPPRV